MTVSSAGEQTMSERIRLSDDGTLDTVLVCRECGAEARYNYDSDNTNDDATDYDAFIEWAIEDFDSEHECEEN
jgi:RNase P subunit RPR2